MINLDNRLLPLVDANELYLLCYITNRIGANGNAWPSNDTLMSETGWHIEKLLRVKKSLEEKKILKVKRSIGRSNRYVIASEYIGNYVNGKSNIVGESDNGKTGNTLTENPVTETGKTDNDHYGKSDKEVLTSEVLTTSEELNTIEELKREKRRLLFETHSVFEKIIECLFPQYNEHTLGWYGDEPKEVDKPDAVTYSVLKKSWGAAEKICAGIKTINRDVEPYRQNHYSGDDPKDDHWDAITQVGAYADYCRLTGTYVTTDFEKLPEKICSVNWCARLLQWAKDPKNKYDVAHDSDLESSWLIEVFYCVIIVYADKEDYDRIVWEGHEYYCK